MMSCTAASSYFRPQVVHITMRQRFRERLLSALTRSQGGGLNLGRQGQQRSFAQNAPGLEHGGGSFAGARNFARPELVPLWEAGLCRPRRSLLPSAKHVSQTSMVRLTLAHRMSHLMQLRALPSKSASCARSSEC